VGIRPGIRDGREHAALLAQVWRGSRAAQQALQLARRERRVVPVRTDADAAEFNNATSDRILGFPDVAKICMLQSYHQNAEQFEILFNKAKFDALPARIKATIENAVEAASADMSWKAVDRYSKDYIEMQQKQNVKFYKTPDAILQSQLGAYDKALEKKLAENPIFKEVYDSQKRFAERAVKWDLDTNVNRRIAYNHYFAKSAAAKKA
jgi:TRAP-type mannitol/chloroaromatic compound transport system substrate-binding protein